MEVANNNPAGRLYNIIRKAQAVAAKEKQPTVMVVWRKTFDSKSVPETLVSISELMKLQGEIYSDSAKAGHVSAMLWPLGELHSALTAQNFDLPWANVAAYFMRERMNALRVIADSLVKDLPNPEIPEDELERIRESISRIFREVTSSDLEDDLKRFLLEQLSLIDEAVKRYMIDGIEPIRRAAAQVIGSATMNRDYWQRLKNSPHGKAVRGVAARVAVIVLAAPGAFGALEAGANAVEQTAVAIEKSVEVWRDVGDPDDVQDAEFSEVEEAPGTDVKSLPQPEEK